MGILNNFLLAVCIGLFAFFAFFAYDSSHHRAPEIEEPYKTRLINTLSGISNHLLIKWDQLAIARKYAAMLGKLHVLFNGKFPDVRASIIRSAQGINYRIYEAGQTIEEEKRPVVIYFHGGGFIMHNKDSVDGMCKDLCKKSLVVFIAPDLPLAPEKPFPNAFEVGLEFAQFIYDHADEMNLDDTRFMVAGEGSGANIAAAVALEMKSKVSRQYLFYPMLQAFDFNTPSYVENDDCLANMNNAELMQLSWGSYLGLAKSDHGKLPRQEHVSMDVMEPYSSFVDSSLHIPESWNITDLKVLQHKKHKVDDALVRKIGDIVLDHRFAPLMALDEVLKEAPPAYIITAGCDVVRDDGVMYAHRLQQVGVKATHHNFGRAFHGFLMVKKWFFIGEIAMDMLEHNFKDAVNLKERSKAQSLKWDPTKGTQGFRAPPGF